MSSQAPSILDYERAVAKRIAAALGTLPPTTQEQIALVTLTVSNVVSDPRYPVISVAAGTSVEAGGPWDPLELPYPALATLGEPDTDPALAGMWRRKSEYYDVGFIDWESPPSGDDWRADDRSSPSQARRSAMSALVGTAGKLRTQLRRRVHLDDQIVLLAITDRLAEDQCLLVTEQMNPSPIPLGAAAFLAGGLPPIGSDPYERSDLIDYARAIAADIVSESIDALDGAHRLMYLDDSEALLQRDHPFPHRYWELAELALNFEHETAEPPSDNWRQQIDHDIIEHSRTLLAQWH